MSRLQKIIATVLVALCIIGYSSMALASRATFTNKRIYGGSSQSITSLARERSINIEQRVDSISWNGQSGWKFRGYSNGQPCTALTTITGTGNWLADFISYPTVVSFRESINSTSAADYLSFNGIVYA